MCVDSIPRNKVQVGRPISSRDGHVVYTPEITFSPSTVAEIQAIIRCAERQTPPRKVHASGSRWSLSSVHKAGDYLIVPYNLRSIIQTRTRDRQRQMDLPLKNSLFDTVYGLIHTQSGVRFRTLYQTAVASNAAVPTQGGGAGGTTIAGITSTGTHGSDREMQPLADYIRAIHLVGPGGRQYWVERSHPNNITDPLGWADSPLNAEDFEVIYDDEVFFATTVSLGRFGVIYALVYELLPAYHMRERRDSYTWPVIRDNYIRATDSAGLFEKFKWSNRDLPLQFPQDPTRFFQIDMSLGTYSDLNDGPSICFITRRCETPPQSLSIPKDKFFLERGNEWEAFENLVLDPHNAAIMTEIGFQNPSELANVFFNDRGRLSNLLNGVGNGTRRRFLELIVKEMLEQHPNIYALGPSWDIDGGTTSSTELPAGDSFEYFFNADEPFPYTDLVDYALDLAKAPQIIGWISLRYTKQTGALIGMHQYEQTVAVEVSILKDIDGNAQYVESVQQRATELGGIPHWGQMHNFEGRREIENYYGSNILMWRRALGRLSRNGRADTFENEFTANLGLVPLQQDNLLLLFS